MITNFGKNLISKFLLGQIDSYANYIAIGTGKSQSNAAPYLTPSAIQATLDFEVARYPIISKGLSDDNGTRQLVFTAQIDSLDRFDITEVGLYSGAFDTLLGNSIGSKLLIDFSVNEGWTYNNTTAPYTSTLKYISNPLDYTNFSTNTIDAQTDGATTLKSYMFDSGNSFFTSTRIDRDERPRIYDSALLILGDMSAGNSTGTTWTYNNFIELANFDKAIDLDNAFSQTDEIRIAMNIINTTSLTTTPSGGIQIILRFITNDGQTYRDYVFDTTSSTNTTWTNGVVPIPIQTPTGTTNITMQTAYPHGLSSGQSVTITGVTPSGYNGTWTTQTGTTGTTLIVNIGSNPGTITTGGTFIANRYAVGKQTLDKGTNSGAFKWSAVNSVRVYAKASDATAASNYGIILDALRFENLSTNNPLYGLVGYSIPITNIIKASDTYGLVEFRFNLGTS